MYKYAFIVYYVFYIFKFYIFIVVGKFNVACT